MIAGRLDKELNILVENEVIEIITSDVFNKIFDTKPYFIRLKPMHI